MEICRQCCDKYKSSSNYFIISLTHYRQANVCTVNKANVHNSFSRISLQNSSNQVYKFCNIYPFFGNFKTDMISIAFCLLRFNDFSGKCFDSIFFFCSIMFVQPLMNIRTRLVRPIENANGKQTILVVRIKSISSEEKRSENWFVVLPLVSESWLLTLALHPWFNSNRIRPMQSRSMPSNSNAKPSVPFPKTDDVLQRIDKL